jgi:hypothetical protein
VSGCPYFFNNYVNRLGCFRRRLPGLGRQLSVAHADIDRVAVLHLTGQEFLGGAGVLQPISGAIMKAMQEAPPRESYATLHAIFGAALLAALAIYLFAREDAPLK